MNKWWSWSIGINLGRQSTKIRAIEYNDHSAALQSESKKDQAGFAYGAQIGIQTIVDNFAISAHLKYVTNTKDNTWSDTNPSAPPAKLEFKQETPSFFIFIVSLGLRF